ncbi:dihydroorotase [Flavobacteriaceae bacterium M23B6Z8]
MLRNSFIAIFSMLMFVGLHTSYSQQSAKTGDTYVIKAVDNGDYQFINFPKKNFIIKRGGIANMKSVAGVEVKVLYSALNNNGVEVATIERTDGRTFFGAFRTVTVALKDAVNSGELQKS